jgi:hypothetical protein
MCDSQIEIYFSLRAAIHPGCTKVLNYGGALAIG